MGYRPRVPLDVLLWIWEQRDAEATCQQIADTLNERGVPTARPTYGTLRPRRSRWHESTVREMLNRLEQSGGVPDGVDFDP